MLRDPGNARTMKCGIAQPSGSAWQKYRSLTRRHGVKRRFIGRLARLTVPSTPSSTDSSSSSNRKRTTANVFNIEIALDLTNDLEFHVSRGYVLPASSKPPADVLSEAMQAAEAAQQQLMTSGTLAEAVRQNSMLRSIMQTHSTLQRLFHKAVLPVVQQYGQLAGSPAGLAYAMLLDLLGRQPTKQPGDTLSSEELNSLRSEVAKVQGIADKPIAKLALAVCDEVGRTNDLFNITEMFVLHDLLETMQFGSKDMADTSSGSVFGITGAMSHFASFVFNKLVAENVLVKYKASLAELLLQACQPADSPPDLVPSAEHSKSLQVAAIGQRMSRSGVIMAALAMLPDEDDQQALTQVVLQINSWHHTAHSSPYRASTGCLIGPTALHGSVVRLCAYSYLGACMHSTAMEQLNGSRPVGDWEPVRQALQFARNMPGRDTDAWMVAEQQMQMLLAAQYGDQRPENFTERVQQTIDKVTDALDGEGATSLASSALLAELGRAANNLRRSSGHRLSSSQSSFLNKMSRVHAEYHTDRYMQGMLKAAQGCCWPLTMYWLDIVQLALQQAGGPGPAAVKEAEQLLKEPHTVFVARLLLRMIDLQLPSYAAQRANQPSLICTSPLHLDRELRRMILARGDVKAAAQLSAMETAATGASGQVTLPPAVHEQASSVFAVRSSGNSSHSLMTTQQFIEQMQQLLVSKESSMEQTRVQIMQLVCSTGAPPPHEQQQLDPALVDQYNRSISVVLAQEKQKGKLLRDIGYWFAAALGQLQIYEESSSAAMAEKLLGPGAVQEQYLRPYKQFLELKQQTADAVMDVVSNLALSVSSPAAVALLTTLLPACATPGISKLHGMMWLVAAACSGGHLNSNAVGAIAQTTDEARRAAAQAGGQSAASQELDVFAHLIVILACMKTKMRPDQASVMLQQMATGQGKPFSQQEPAVQAIIQGLTKVLLSSCLPEGSALPASVLQLVTAVPLLHAEDYSKLLARSASGGPFEATSVVWKAAVAAATDQHLSHLPAFGGQRPNEQWLAQQLQLLVLMQPQAAPVEFLVPAFEGAMQLLQSGSLLSEDPSGSSVRAADASGAAEYPGLVLLDAVCYVLSCTVMQLPHSTFVVPMVTAIATTLVKQQQLLRPQALVPALCAVARAGAVVAGDTAVHDLAIQQAAGLRLTAADVASIRCAALEGATRATGKALNSESLLVRLWADAAAAGKGLPEGTAKAVSSIINASSAAAAEHLLHRQLPSKVLESLIQAALTSKHSAAVQQLVQHAEQHSMLQQLPPVLLAAALQYNSGKVAGAGNLQLLSALLQQGRAPDAAAAAALLRDSELAERQQWQQLLNWLQEQCSTAPAAAAHEFLCSTLQAAAAPDAATCDQAWQVYGVMVNVQQTQNWPAAQQGLPAHVCSFLMAQQMGDTEPTASIHSANRVLQLWQQYKSSKSTAEAVAAQQLQSEQLAAVTGLQPAGQEALLTALVTVGQHQQAVQVVQQVPALLLHLANTLQVQHQQRKERQQVQVDAETLGQALEIAVDEGTSSAAAAAGQLLTMLEPVEYECSAIQGTAAVQLVQLLCKHGHISAAQQLVSGRLLAYEPLQIVAAAVADIVAAVAVSAASAPDKDLNTNQQQQLVQFLSELPADEAIQSEAAFSGQQVLLAALDTLLLMPEPATPVALLLHVLQGSNNSRQQATLGAKLAPQQLEQVCKLVCGTNSASSSSLEGRSDSAVVRLPTPYQLALDCMRSSVVLSAEATIALVNAIGANQPDLKPARAAHLFGIVAGGDLHITAADTLSSSGSGSRLPNAVADHQAKQAGQLLAQLCYTQLPNELSEADDYDSILEHLGWVDTLTHEAAAAALFAAWYWAQPGVTAAAATAGAKALLRPPTSKVQLGVLCLQLYHAARPRQEKPSLDSLLLDLALLAAAEAGNWDEGKAVIGAAERVLASTSGIALLSSSKRSAGSSQAQGHMWIPLLPAALAALPVVLVHSQGVEKTAQLLLQKYEQHQALEQPATAAAGRRGKRGAAAGTAAASHAAGQQHSSLLRTPVVNGFLSAVVDVASAAKTDADDDAAVGAALTASKVAAQLFSQQLHAVQLSAVGSSSSPIAIGAQQGSLSPDAATWASLAQLYGIAGRYQQVATITMAAAKRQLPLAGPCVQDVTAAGTTKSPQDPTADALQEVLCGAAAAWRAADRADVVVLLLDGLVAAGVTELTHPGLAEHLAWAADTQMEALASRLEGGEEAVFELVDLDSQPTLQHAVEGSGGGRAVRLVSNKGRDTTALAQAMQEAIKGVVV